MPQRQRVYPAGRKLHAEGTHPRGHALRRGRASLPGVAYFVTKCAAEPGVSVLSNPLCALSVVRALRWLRANRLARVCGFVVMPDHYHAVLGVGSKRTLEELMASLNRHTSRRINEILGRRGQFWEKGFHDRAVRDRREFDGFLEYMHVNPVKEGLVESPAEWRFSSANQEFSDLIDWEWVGIKL